MSFISDKEFDEIYEKALKEVKYFTLADLVQPEVSPFPLPEPQALHHIERSSDQVISSKKEKLERHKSSHLNKISCFFHRSKKTELPLKKSSTALLVALPNAQEGNELNQNPLNKLKGKTHP